MLGEYEIKGNIGGKLVERFVVELVFDFLGLYAVGNAILPIRQSFVGEVLLEFLFSSERGLCTQHAVGNGAIERVREVFLARDLESESEEVRRAPSFVVLGTSAGDRGLRNLFPLRV